MVSFVLIWIPSSIPYFIRCQRNIAQQCATPPAHYPVALQFWDFNQGFDIGKDLVVHNGVDIDGDAVLCDHLLGRH